MTRERSLDKHPKPSSKPQAGQPAAYRASIAKNPKGSSVWGELISAQVGDLPWGAASVPHIPRPGCGGPDTPHSLPFSPQQLPLTTAGGRCGRSGWRPRRASGRRSRSRWCRAHGWAWSPETPAPRLSSLQIWLHGATSGVGPEVATRNVEAEPKG